MIDLDAIKKRCAAAIQYVDAVDPDMLDQTGLRGYGSSMDRICRELAKEAETLLAEVERLRAAINALFGAFVEVCETSTGRFTPTQVEAVQKFKEVTGR